MQKKIFLLPILVFLTTTLLIGQANSELTVENSFFTGISFKKADSKLSFEKVLILVNENETAKTFLRKSKNQATASSIVGAIGGFFIGFPIGTAIGGGEPNWNLLYAGVGVSIISIPIYNSAVKNARKGAQQYNETLVTNYKSPQLLLTINPVGAGFKLSF